MPSPPAAEKMMPPRMPPAIPMRIVPMQPAPLTPVTPFASAPAMKPTTIHDSQLMSLPDGDAAGVNLPVSRLRERLPGYIARRLGRCERSPVGWLDRFPARSRRRGRHAERPTHPEREAPGLGERDGRPLRAGFRPLVRGD